MTARPDRPLIHLRRRLTLWYSGTFALILLALGGLLFHLITRQATQELHDSLRAAAHQIALATDIREREAVSGGSAADAVEELHIPDRALYLFDVHGTLLTPATPPRPRFVETVRHALQHGPVQDELQIGPDQTLVGYAEPFTLANGHRYIALVIADEVELEDRYADLIVTFAVLAGLALILIAGGGWFLARAATRPVERNLISTRRFMAEAAHELRTPIAILRSRADVALQRDRPASGYISALTHIRTEAERMGHIVDDLLLLARADTGERPLTRERMALDDVMLDTVTAASALAASRNVRLTIDRADESTIEADPALIRQLGMILLDNALKYTPPNGTVTVTVTSTPAQAALAVTDTGVGIAPEEQSRVFDRFYRGAAVRGTTGGAGLGLSIAQWIAEAHGARIVLESVLGQGTIVRVLFPR